MQNKHCDLSKIRRLKMKLEGIVVVTKLELLNSEKSPGKNRFTTGHKLIFFAMWYSDRENKLDYILLTPRFHQESLLPFSQRKKK